MRISLECVLKVIKSLYEVPETDNHWFKTYHDHHTDKLKMIQFTYDSCLLYTLIFSQIDLRVVDMQTDDIFILADQSFVVIEEEALFIVKIMIKSREKLISNNALKFNDTRIERLESNEIEIIYFRQETHIQGIQLIKVEFTIITGVRDKIRAMLILRNQYIAQRAREAYLA